MPGRPTTLVVNVIVKLVSLKIQHTKVHFSHGTYHNETGRNQRDSKIMYKCVKVCSVGHNNAKEVFRVVVKRSCIQILPP